MPFSQLNLPIQEMLQSDFITDLAQIHNSNVLILKDKIEDLFNTFEIDINTITIGVDNPINKLYTQDLVIQDGGWIFQTGIPNQIIARLERNGNGESVMNVDILNVDLSMSVDSIVSNDIVTNNSITSNGDAQFNAQLEFTSSYVESKETVSQLLEFDGVDTAEATVTLSNTSNRNIYLKLLAETASGATQVWDGSNLVAGLTNIKVYLDFDTNNPPSVNTTFTIHLVDVVANSNLAPLLTQLNASAVGLTIQPGTNNSTATPIILHNNFVSNGLSLGINPGSSLNGGLSGALTYYGANATFNYILDENTDDRLMITAYSGMEIF